MNRFIVLDSGPLRLTTLAAHKPDADNCRAWIAAMKADGAVIVVTEIADYEVRRRHCKDQATAGLRRLDAMKAAHEYRPITTEIMLLAAELWGMMRRIGRGPSPPEAIDGDAILVATVRFLGRAGDIVTIATGDGDITRFPGIDARGWKTID